MRQGLERQILVQPGQVDKVGCALHPAQPGQGLPWTRRSNPSGKSRIERLGGLDRHGLQSGDASDEIRLTVGRQAGQHHRGTLLRQLRQDEGLRLRVFTFKKPGDGKRLKPLPNNRAARRLSNGN